MLIFKTIMQVTELFHQTNFIGASLGKAQHGLATNVIWGLAVKTTLDACMSHRTATDTMCTGAPCKQSLCKNRSWKHFNES